MIGDYLLDGQHMRQPDEAPLRRGSQALHSHATGVSMSSKGSKTQKDASMKKKKTKKDPTKQGLTDERWGHDNDEQFVETAATFNDFAFDRNGAVNDPSPYFVGQPQHFKSHPHSSTSTPVTSKTSTTMGSYEQSCVESWDGGVGAPPVRQIDISQNEAPKAISFGTIAPPDLREKKAMAAFHGEMLQSFLTKHGRDEKLAMEQAMMFEAFLKSQADISHLTGTAATTLLSTNPQNNVPYNHAAAELHAVAQLKVLELEEDEESRMEQVESMCFEDTDDLGSFAPDTAWDNGSFQSFPANALNHRSAHDDPFGRMRRNETFMRHKSDQDADNRPRSRNALAGAQARALSGQYPQMSNMSPNNSPPQHAPIIFPKVTKNSPQRHAPTSLPRASTNSPLHTAPIPKVSSSLPYLSTDTMSFGGSHRGPDSNASLTGSQHSGSLGEQRSLGGSSRKERGTMERNGSIDSRSITSAKSAPDAVVTRVHPSFEDQLNMMTMAQRSCVYALKTTWEQGEGKSKPFPNLWYIKFAKCSPGAPYDFKEAIKVMKKFDRRYINISIMAVERQLKSRCIFPCPGLRSSDGHEVLYFGMKHFSPKEDSVSAIVDNLVYVMNSMMEHPNTCTDGVALICNLSGFKMHNFSVAYFHKFIMALQGRKIPTRVNMWLLVNPPAWFGSLWQIMKPMMTEDFRKKLFRINEKEMGQYLTKGYETYLPDDMTGGAVKTDKLIHDFIVDRKQVEGRRMIQQTSRHSIGA